MFAIGPAVRTTLGRTVTHCTTVPEMNQVSDQIPISTRLRLSCEPLTKLPRRAWKLLNMDMVKEIEKRTPAPRMSYSIEEIDQYTKEIQDYLKEIVDKAVP